MMDRRSFIAAGASTVITATQAKAAHRIVADNLAASVAPARTTSNRVPLDRHRFGLNYTPSRNWWFCWNDWDTDSIKYDLDGIAALGADHLRILLIWPYFQPNLRWVSPSHLERLSLLLALMESRHLDALVTVFTGQLSGWMFLPPFNKPNTAFYTDPGLWAAQELFVRALARTLREHNNVIGFDFGNEINTCWSAEPSIGDAWMAKMFALMKEVLPDGVHVNGVDHVPWFRPTTFSAQALAANPFPVMHCYPYWSQALKYGGVMDPPSTGLLKAMAALIRAYAGSAQKPVWAEEFSTCIETMPDKQQAQWLETAVTGAIESGVSWFTYWCSHDVNRKFAFNSVEYTLGLLTNEGKVKEQGRVFKQLAEAYRDKPVVFPKAAPVPPPTPQNYDATWKWMLDYLGWKPKDVAM